jgi:anti-sigma B factor antagonist
MSCGRLRHDALKRYGGGTLDAMSSFSTRTESNVLVIEFDTASGLNDFRNNALRDSLYELVLSSSEPRFAVDLVKVDYLSSSGVALLVGLKRRVETRGGKIVLYRVQPIVHDLLAVMKLDKFFSIVDNEQQALISLRPVSTA